MKMEEWKECKLGDIVEIHRGASPRPIQKFIATSGMPWVKISDATASNSRFIDSTKEFIIEDGISKSIIVNPEDLIVSNSATPGLPKIMKIKACIHDGWLYFSNYKNISRDFLYYKFFDIQRYLTNLANGSVFQNLKTDIVKDFTIKLPTLPTQQKIAAILSSLDDKIELNNKINTNLEQQAQALFKNWFVDFEPFGGKMPEGWKECKAEEYFEISIGKTPPRKEQEWFSEKKTDQTMKWVSISDMGSCGLFISDSSEYLTADAVTKFNVKVVPANTVLLSFKLTIGRIAITDDEMCTNEAIAHFVTQNKVINEYLYLYLKNFNYQTMGSTSSIATAVNSKIIKAMLFIVPDEKAINNFHQATNSLFEKIRENQHENRTLSTIRNTLLPKLMNGEIEVI